MGRRKYQGKRVQDNRARAKAQLPTQCHYCGNIVDESMRWEADHPVPRVQAEALGIPDQEQDQLVVPVHASCNHRAGARLSNTHRQQLPGRAVPPPIRRAVRFSDGPHEPRREAPLSPSPNGSGDEL